MNFTLPHFQKVFLYVDTFSGDAAYLQFTVAGNSQVFTTYDAPCNHSPDRAARARSDPFLSFCPVIS